MNEAVQSAFARYPYPAVFFTWHESRSAADILLAK